MVVVAAHDAFMRSAERLQRTRNRVAVAATLVLASVLVLLVGRWALRPTAGPVPVPAPTVLAAQPVTPTAPQSPSGVTTGTAPVVAPAAKPAAPKGSRGTPGQASVESTATAAAAPDTATGKLRVRAIPGSADIVIDGQTVGQGAIVDRDVLAGMRRLHISASGYTDFDTTIVVRAGETTRLNPIELKAEP
jgi:hypothetical protein